jgi:hypothetical protein
MAAEVQWGLTFARADPDRIGERPPVVRDLFLRAVISRTTMAEGTGQIAAAGLRLGFLIGRGGPNTLADGLYDLPQASPPPTGSPLPPPKPTC